MPGTINFISTRVPPFTYPHQVTFKYDPALGVVDFSAELPVNTWFSIGFGSNMFNTDMITMQAYTTLAKSQINDMWSTSVSTPTFDKVDNLTNKKIVENTARGTQTFTFSRKLDTGDTLNDFVIPVDKPFPMCFAINYKQS